MRLISYESMTVAKVDLSERQIAAIIHGTGRFSTCSE